MKKVVLFVGVAIMALSIGMSAAMAKPAWKKDLGVENCAVCHLEDKKAPNESNKMWKASKDMAAKNKDKPCVECHKGQVKPPK